MSMMMREGEHDEFSPDVYGKKGERSRKVRSKSQDPRHCTSVSLAVAVAVPALDFHPSSATATCVSYPLVEYSVRGIYSTCTCTAPYSIHAFPPILDNPTIVT
ncbi:hypothetical protein ACLOJK_031244 [Asimina triloba]